MKVYLKITIVLLTLAYLGCSKKKDENKSQNLEISEYFDNLVANRDFSGVVLIGNSEEILTTYVSGYSDFTNKKEHTNDSKFAVASISKTFTSAGILKLKNEGKIQLSDKVGKYLPEFKYGNKITILHLLRHESGLAEIGFKLLKNDFLNSKMLVSEIEKNPLLFEPGENGSYSNAGFSLLARIIEVVSGLTYEEYLKTKLLSPNGIVNTGDLSTQKMPKKLSKPNFPSALPELVKSIPNVNYSLFLGSGSIYSTASDLWIWGNSIINKSKINIFDEEYPYGWGRDSIAGKFFLNQTGMNEGFVTSLYLFPDENIVIVLLSNIENGMWVDWTKDVAKIYFKDLSKVNYPQRRDVQLEQIINPDQYTGTYKLNSDRIVEIKNNNGNLFLHLNSYYKGHYLTPTENNSFDLRSFTGKITFKNKDTLQWTLPKSWGGNSDIYIRQN